jgi:hypothetical protein
VKIDFTRPILDLSGKPIESDGQPLTLEMVTVSSLLQPAKDPNGTDKYRRYTLIRMIHGATEVDLKTDDIVYIKKLIGESPFTPIVTGQAYDMLENKAEEKTPGC